MATVPDLIRERRDAIVFRWAAVAQWAEPSRGLGRGELLDVLPEYVDALARDAADDERAALVASHLGARVRLGFHAHEVVEELALLGRCIDEECRAARPPSATVEGREALGDEIRRRSAGVLEIFAAHMREDEQDDKRTCREIERLARAQRRGAVPVPRALRELLAVALASLGAAGAALVVHRAATEPPAAWGSVGLGAGALEPLATGETASALRTRVLRSRCPQQTQELAADTGAELAAAGLGSVLGARLRPQHGLTGALYVGLAERRALAARELIRAEMLGERLLLHLAAALADDALRRANEQLHAERASQEELVARLADELQAPLSVARAAVRGLIEQPPGHDRRDLAVKIDRSLDRADRRLRDVLDASLVRAGHALPLRVVACDLVELARSVAAELAALHGARFAIDAPSSLPGFWDGEALRRALRSLATNAVEHGSRERPIRIRAALRGERAQVSVHDFGDTLPEDDRARLFEPQLRRRSLTLVRGCAEAHGGRALVRSASGETTFVIELPLDARPRAGV